MRSLHRKEDRAVPNSLAKMNAGELVQKLTAHAVRVFAEFGLRGPDVAMPSLGSSPEDFASDLFIEYATGKIKVKELPYLYRALRNNILDKLGSAAQKTTDHMPVSAEGNADGEGMKHLDGFPSKERRVDDLLCEESYKARVRACVATEPELTEIVEAVLDLGLLKPAEIADAIGISAKEVYVRNRKLARRLIKHGLKMVPS
jgi:DNA-directed RNA polymerase specialized sigma24 family protein